MEPDRFDALARTLGRVGSRRVAVGLVTRAAVAGVGARVGAGTIFGPLGASAKKRKGRGKSCAIGKKGSVHITTASSFDGQPLRLEQTIQPPGRHGQGGSRTKVTLAGASLLNIVTKEVDGRLRVTITFGKPISGVEQVQFTIDETALEGTINGQPVAPLAPDADPADLRMANGDLPPEVVIDPALAEAMDGLLQQAEQVAASCQPARSAAQNHAGTQGVQGQAGGGSHTYRLCRLPVVLCSIQALLCLFDVARSCGGSFVCWAMGLWRCRLASNRCYAAIPPNACCSGLTVTCSSDEECCGGGSNSVDCAFVANNKGRFGCGFRLVDNSPRCCQTGTGGGCRDDCECCGGLVCVNGGCICKQLFQTCRHASECCPSLDGRQTCAAVQPKQDGQDSCLVDPNAGESFCCQPEGALCQGLCDCCGSLLCRDGMCVSCVPFLEACSDSGQCCSGAQCIGGLCRYT
jgi:hypothetical protein